MAHLNQHRFDEIGSEKPRASVVVGDQRDHHDAAQTRHDRMIARRELSRNRRKRDLTRARELELFLAEIYHSGYRLPRKDGHALRRVRIQPLSKTPASPSPAKAGVDETRQPAASAATTNRGRATSAPKNARRPLFDTKTSCNGTMFCPWTPSQASDRTGGFPESEYLDLGRRQFVAGGCHPRWGPVYAPRTAFQLHLRVRNAAIYSALVLRDIVMVEQP